MPPVAVKSILPLAPPLQLTLTLVLVNVIAVGCVMVTLLVAVQLFAEALLLYRQRQDKSYSLTDCASMLIMRQQNISDDVNYSAK